VTDDNNNNNMELLGFEVLTTVVMKLEDNMQSSRCLPMIRRKILPPSSDPESEPKKKQAASEARFCYLLVSL
jgi:hypothetical protein